MNRDTVIGIVGAVVLVAAMVGIFVYEANHAPPVGAGDRTALASRAGPSVTGDALGEGESANEEVVLDMTGLRGANFTLAWNDDLGEPDVFRLRVTSPNGTSLTSVEEDDGEIVLAFPDLGEDSAGTWLVTVECVSAGDQTAPVGGVAVQQDAGNAWRLDTEVVAPPG